jgi:hypothetical protein
VGGSAGFQVEVKSARRGTSRGWLEEDPDAAPAWAREYSLGQLENVRERFYAISVERKLTHPAVLLIAEQARRRLFTPAAS